MTQVPRRHSVSHRSFDISLRVPSQNPVAREALVTKRHPERGASEEGEARPTPVRARTPSACRHRERNHSSCLSAWERQASGWGPLHSSGRRCTCEADGGGNGAALRCRSARSKPCAGKQMAASGSLRRERARTQDARPKRRSSVLRERRASEGAPVDSNDVPRDHTAIRSPPSPPPELAPSACKLVGPPRSARTPRPAPPCVTFPQPSSLPRRSSTEHPPFECLPAGSRTAVPDRGARALVVKKRGKGASGGRERVGARREAVWVNGG